MERENEYESRAIVGGVPVLKSDSFGAGLVLDPGSCLDRKKPMPKRAELQIIAKD